MQFLMSIPMVSTFIYCCSLGTCSSVSLFFFIAFSSFLLFLIASSFCLFFSSSFSFVSFFFVSASALLSSCSYNSCASISALLVACSSFSCNYLSFSSFWVAFSFIVCFFSYCNTFLYLPIWRGTLLCVLWFQ